MKRTWKSISVPDVVLSICPDAKAFESGRLKVIKSTDANRLHLSISHQDRYPKWDEIKEARDYFLPPGKIFIMALPPEKYYVNLHKNCFHLWELSEDDEPEICWIIRNM